MSNIKLNNIPKLQLADLLKRRKMSLHTFLNEFGIETYEGLLTRCARIGVVAPSEQEFQSVHGPRIVSSPQEGIIVIETQETNVTNEEQEEPEDPKEETEIRNGLVELQDSPIVRQEEKDGAQKKYRKKKEVPKDNI